MNTEQENIDVKRINGELVEALESLAEVDGACSIQDGIVCFEDGTLIDLNCLLTKAKGGQA